MIDSERLDLPSASSFVITANCPGSKALIASLPSDAFNPEYDEMAARGVKIHRAWETGDTSNLLEDELDDYNRTLELAEATKNLWVRSIGLADTTFTIPIVQIKERRLWYHDPETLKPVASGQTDETLIVTGDAYVRDLKSGWCHNLSPSEQSWQLRLLSVLVWMEYREKYGVKRVRASFLKPKFYRQSVDTVEYNETNLQRAAASVEQALWEADQPGAQRRPGTHCTYCPAKPYCHEAGAYALVNHVPDLPAPAERGVAYMPISSLATIQRRAKIITKILEAVKARLKSLPPDELQSVGFRLNEGRRMDPIVKTRDAFNRLMTMAEGATWADELWTSLKFSKSELIEAYRRSHPGITKKTAEEKIISLLSDCIESKRTEGSLEEI